jgi:hypothetical protein
MRPEKTPNLQALPHPLPHSANQTSLLRKVSKLKDYEANKLLRRIIIANKCSPQLFIPSHNVIIRTQKILKVVLRWLWQH